MDNKQEKETTMTKQSRLLHPYIFGGMVLCTIWIAILAGSYLYQLTGLEKPSPSTLEILSGNGVDDCNLLLFIIAVHVIWAIVTFVYSFEYGASEFYRHRKNDSTLRRIEEQVKELVGYRASCSLYDNDTMVIVRVWDVPEDMRIYVERYVYDGEKQLLPCPEWSIIAMVYTPEETILFNKGIKDTHGI